MNEINRIFKLHTIVFTENDDTKFKISVPDFVAYNEGYGLHYIQLICLVIKDFLKNITGNENFNNYKTINKIMLNIFNNEEYLAISRIVYRIFTPVCDTNGKTLQYKVKETINFKQLNLHTTNYDMFEEIVEQIYHTI